MVAILDDMMIILAYTLIYVMTAVLNKWMNAPFMDKVT